MSGLAQSMDMYCDRVTKEFFFDWAETFSGRFGPLRVRICKKFCPSVSVSVTVCMSNHTKQECVYAKVISRFLQNFVCKFIWATPCGATVVASVSFTSILAFYIHDFGYQKFAKTIKVPPTEGCLMFCFHTKVVSRELPEPNNLGWKCTPWVSLPSDTKKKFVFARDRTGDLTRVGRTW